MSAALLASAFAVLLVPGPSVLHVVGEAAARGRRAGLLAVLAVDAGYLLQLVAVAVGLGEVVSRSQTALVAVRVAGVLFLVVLGLRAVRRRGRLAAAAHGSARGGEPATAGMRAGLIVGLLNPKRLLLLVAVLPQVDGGRGPGGLLGPGAAIVGAAVVADALWALLAGRAGPWLRRRPVRLERLGAAAGAVMLVLAARLAVAIATG